MSKSFEVRGVDGLLKQLHKNANLDDVKNVVKMNATELERNAKRDAPVDTGFLRRSIGLEFEDAGFTARVMATAEYAGCYQIARNVINYVLESVKIGGNLIVKPFFRVWNVI